MITKTQKDSTFHYGDETTWKYLNILRFKKKKSRVMKFHQKMFFFSNLAFPLVRWIDNFLLQCPAEDDTRHSQNIHLHTKIHHKQNTKEKTY